jgi:hypothetical protein
MLSGEGSHDFAIGQRVVLHIGRNDLPAIVVEDRGNLGVDGSRIYRVAVQYDEDAEPSEFEVPASALAAAPRAAA